MIMKWYVRIVMVVVLGVAFWGWAAEPSKPPSETGKNSIAEVYPGLASGGLAFATLADLPEGVLLRSGGTDITAEAINEELSKAPESVREKLKKNAFFVLEQIATKKLVLEAAKRQAAEAKQDIASKSEQEILDGYVEGTMRAVQVTDADIAAFYDENKDACGGVPLEQAKEELRKYVLKQKQQDVLMDHIRTIGQRMPISVAAAWTKEQAAAATDNPVDQARKSGKPSLVDFGSNGCRPCEMMTPILADLKKKYEDKANVLFVHVREEQVLAARFGIQAIPVQIFFDKDGKETYRHTGFFPQAEIEKRLAAMGAQ
jgi:thioredoxin 1